MLMRQPQDADRLQDTHPNAGLRRPFANARARAVEGFRQGFGDRELGIAGEVLARYPALRFWEDDARIVDGLGRSWSGLLRGGAGFIGGWDQDLGSSEADSRRLQGELNALTEILGARRLGR